MIQSEFEAAFIDFMKSHKLRPGKRDVEFEWETFKCFQDDMCRDVEFGEYLDIVKGDWLEK